MFTHFYFIRHGETDWNKQRKIQGHTDIPLNQTGMDQALRIAKRMANEPLDVICSSDLSRAIKTAQQIKVFHPESPLLIFPDLRERNYGVWEGKRFEDIPKANKNTSYGIETLEEVQRRGIARLDALCMEFPGRHIAVVSHGGFINAMLHLLSNGEHGTGITRLGNTSLNHLSRDQNKWTLHLINDTTHLED